MDEEQNQRQIQQMVGFILNEAKDKAEEIDAKALEDFNVERLKHALQMKEKFRAEFAKKRKQCDTQRAIARSGAINKARLQKIECRQEYLGKLNGECTKELKSYTKTTAKYQQLLADLIVQGCLKLMETEVCVRCKKDEERVVQSVLEAASRKYSDIIKKTTGQTQEISLSIDDKQSLPAKCSGGVVVHCQGDTIRVDNTLDTRLQLTMENDLPAIRKMCFQH